MSVDDAGSGRFSRALREEAHHQATMLLQSGVPVDEARQELIDNRIPEALAVETLARIRETRTSTWRSTAIGLIVVGCVLLAGGFLVTASSYAFSDGGSYVLMTGALGAGAASLLVGLGMLLSRRG